MLTVEQKKTLKKQGFKVITDISKIDEHENLNGVLIRDGSLIICNGFNEHRFVYPLLHKLGLVDSADWIHDSSAFHISSNQLNGSLAYRLKDSFLYSDIKITPQQLETLFKLRNILDNIYGEHETIANSLYHYVSNNEDHGGKYNGLSFLQLFYSKWINLPVFSKDVKGLYNKWINSPSKNEFLFCIRTSPDHSLPGLLNSKFNVDEKRYKKFVKEIESDFEKYKDIVADNKLHWFFQEQLSGINGVCNVRGREKVLTYDVSKTQGNIVKGKSGEVKLKPVHEKQLKKIATMLATDFNKSIQLEFVIQRNVLYIVQFRILQNEPEQTVKIEIPKKALAFGQTFSKGKIDVDVKDILIVDEDGESELLLGKKALIVKNNMEFSHLLALSKRLRIPSMYNTGNINFKNKKTVKFVAYNEKSWIL